ncbi:MAG: DUF58 domain-containing protein [Bauldia sp.]|nr:DUF58 domain-containing protein [Bauldia sp.]
MPRAATASLGIGERRSRAKGAGLEFADHRAYQPGDDIRHLDLQLHARLGEHYVRQYSVFRQLPVTVALDASASMDFGEPSKYALATTLAETIAFVGLAHGDLVRAAVHAGGRLALSDPYQGARRAPVLFDWIERHPPSGSGSLAHAVRLAESKLPRGGLLVLVSDWWADDIEDDIKMLAARGHEIVLVHISAPEEIDPTRLGAGGLRLVDSEDGGEIELPVEGRVIEEYKRAFERHRDGLKGVVLGQRGRYFAVTSGEDPARVILQDWRKAGFIA